jgi:hypothetical protein
MKIGDLVRRKKPLTPPSHGTHVADTTRLGIVTGLRMGGNGPRHEIASVLYTGTLRQYDIAVSLIEVIA